MSWHGHGNSAEIQPPNSIADRWRYWPAPQRLGGIFTRTIGMKTFTLRWTPIAGSLQLVLALLVLCCDFAHGIVLGQYDIGFHPEYRMRQTLAVAISRMHDNPARGYLVYQSVLDALNENGMTIFPEDKGPQLDDDGWTALFKDPVRMDAALRQAKETVIDHNLPPQLIRGSELAYVDYAYFAFKLFGLHMSSFYYFYFLLLGLACVLFVIEFRDSPFSMFLLSTYLGGLFFLQNYVQAGGNQLATLVNNRLLDALSLLPAMHVYLVVWKRLPIKLSTFATTAVQSALLAFLIDCRAASRWQIAPLVVAAVGLIVVDLLLRKSLALRWRGKTWNGVWATCIALAFLAAHMMQIGFSADAAYKSEPKYHPIWGSVLSGLLSSSALLQNEYLGRIFGDGEAPLPDEVVDQAISNDLNKRHDSSSPLAQVNNDGTIEIGVDNGKGPDPNYGWDEYDRIARALAIRIVMQHPLEVIRGFYIKTLNQIELYNRRDALSFVNWAGMIAIAIAGGVLWVGGGIHRVTSRDLLSGAAAVILVLFCAAIPPMIEPSALSVGTLLAYLVAGSIAPFAVVLLIIDVAQHCSFRAAWPEAKHPTS
jgi:hypothetical protein